MDYFSCIDFIFCDFTRWDFTRSRRLSCRHISWLADTAYHLSIIGRLRTADPFILEHPVISGQPLTYPFMLHILSALYQKCGLSLFSAWHFSNAIFGIPLVFILYLFGKRLLKNNTLSAVMVAIVIFGGGIGFFLYFSV